MNEIIRTEKVSYVYKNYGRPENLAVDEATITIEKGQFIAIIGHNGSGKSTLAKHFNSLLVPTSGKVFIKGLDTADFENTWEIRQTAGMVFQNPDNQIVATIVEEDVAFGPENMGVEPLEIRKRVDEALKSVGMQEYGEDSSHNLSGGQKQRIAIAGILAMKPKVIIMDEATAMLDPSGRRDVMETVERLHKEEGITVVIITHFMDEAVNSDKIYVMNEGKIVMEGTPKEVFMKVPELKALGLEVPHMMELSHELREAGIEISEEVLTVEDMAAELEKHLK